MDDYMRLLKALTKLYKQLGSQMSQIKTSDSEATFSNGYVAGLQTAKQEIGKLLFEELERCRRLLAAIFRDQEDGDQP